MARVIWATHWSAWTAPPTGTSSPVSTLSDSAVSGPPSQASTCAWPVSSTGSAKSSPRAPARPLFHGTSPLEPSHPSFPPLPWKRLIQPPSWPPRRPRRHPPPSPHPLWSPLSWLHPEIPRNLSNQRPPPGINQCHRVRSSVEIRRHLAWAASGSGRMGAWSRWRRTARCNGNRHCHRCSCWPRWRREYSALRSETDSCRSDRLARSLSSPAPVRALSPQPKQTTRVFLEKANTPPFDNFFWNIFSINISRGGDPLGIFYGPFRQIELDAPPVISFFDSLCIRPHLKRESFFGRFQNVFSPWPWWSWVWSTQWCNCLRHCFTKTEYFFWTRKKKVLKLNYLNIKGKKTFIRIRQLHGLNPRSQFSNDFFDLKNPSRNLFSCFIFEKNSSNWFFFRSCLVVFV